MADENRLLTDEKAQEALNKANLGYPAIPNNRDKAIAKAQDAKTASLVRAEERGKIARQIQKMPVVEKFPDEKTDIPSGEGYYVDKKFLEALKRGS